MIKYIKKDGDKFIDLKSLTAALGIEYDSVVEHAGNILENRVGQPIEYIYYKDVMFLSYCGLYLTFSNSIVDVESVLKVCL